MSEILNRAGINAVLGAGSVVLNDYALNITPIERGYRLTVKRGSETQTMDVMDGVGIVGIEKTGSTGDVDSYRITFTDGSIFDYTVETNAAAHAAAEAARVEAENSRAGAEAARESAEAGRVSAEDARVEAEAARESAETARASAESARAQAEGGRHSAEAARVAAEQSRASAESVRVAAENARVAAETARANAENERAGAETLRAAAETDRANAESGRVSAELERASAESERVAAEEARATEFAGFSGEINELKYDKLDKTGTAADSDKLGGQLPEHYATAQSVNQLKNDVTAITPDDTVVDGKPWTSKKTVDSLCMPIEATGNHVQVYPVEGYPLGVKVSWEPVQTGEGDPSPENIRPISGRDAVSVTRCGKNLFSVGIANVFIAIDGSQLPLEGAVTTPKIPCKAGDKFILTCKNTFAPAPGNIGVIAYFDASDALLNRVANTSSNQNTLTAPENASYVLASCYAPTEEDEIVFELGSTATPYEPYTGSTTDIALPETVYGGTLDVESGVVTVEYGHIASYAGEPLPGEWISDRDVYASDATPTNGAQVVYKLKTPYTIQLSPQQIAALFGVNTLFTDAGTLTVTGRTDPIWLTQSLMDRIAALESAATNI